MYYIPVPFLLFYYLLEVKFYLYFHLQFSQILENFDKFNFSTGIFFQVS